MLIRQLKIHILLLFMSIFIFACNNNEPNKPIINDTNIAATIENDTINLFEIDSAISQQIYDLRMQYFEVLISRRLLKNEAEKQGIEISRLVETKINNLATKVTTEDILNYIKTEEIDYVDTTSIINYLTLLKQKQRHSIFIDSLKENTKICIKLVPPLAKTIDTSGIYYHKLNNLESENIIYIISDYKCSACIKAEKKLQLLYKKYNKEIEFRFVYFSSYIDKAGLASEAAFNQNKFLQMHDKLFSSKLNNKFNFIKLAANFNIDTVTFNKDMNDSNILKTLVKNRNLLISREIYSTPSFIINNKLYDDKNAMLYIETIIKNEINYMSNN